MKEPYDWDVYAATFFPHAETLEANAQAAAVEGNKEKASELYLYVFVLLRESMSILKPYSRASALYRIARFPIPRSSKQREAWERGKDACRKGLA